MADLIPDEATLLRETIVRLQALLKSVLDERAVEAIEELIAEAKARLADLTQQ
jgi:hypothetical protein